MAGPTACSGSGGIEWKILRQVFGVSVWIMLQEAIAFISWFIFFVAIENLGERPLAVTNMVRSISSVVFLFINAFASTASSLVGNLIGAGEADRVWGLCRRMVRLCFAFVLPVSLLFALLPRVVLGAYTGNAELIAAAVPSLWVMLTTIVPCVPAFIYQFSVSGTGNTRTALELRWSASRPIRSIRYGSSMSSGPTWRFAGRADHVYYLISLALSYAYIRSGRWRRLKI